MYQSNSLLSYEMLFVLCFHFIRTMWTRSKKARWVSEEGKNRSRIREETMVEIDAVFRWFVRSLFIRSAFLSLFSLFSAFFPPIFPSVFSFLFVIRIFSLLKPMIVNAEWIQIANCKSLTSQSDWLSSDSQFANRIQSTSIMRSVTWA